MGQKGGGRPESPGHPVQLPLEDPSISTLVPAASKGICQTPSHKGLSPTLSSGSLAAGGTKLPCGAGARAGRASGLLLVECSVLPRACTLTLGRGVRWFLQRASNSHRPTCGWAALQTQGTR